MRESLTFLATVLLALLLAALIVPSFVDWRDWRAGIEARLSRIVGAPVAVGGQIRLRFLPTPRLELGAVAIGTRPPPAGPATAPALGQDVPAASSATLELLELELAPGDLLRGRLRFVDANAEGMVLSLQADAGGGISLPATATGPDSFLAFERLRIGRSEIRLVSPDGSMKSIGPVAIEASAPQLAGPWRIEGEVAGQSLRLLTGEAEAGGRTRARLQLTGERGRLTLDGHLLTAVEGQGSQPKIQPGFEGSLNLALAPAIDTGETAVVTVSAKAAAGRQLVVLSDIGLALGEGAATRLEGEARLDFAGAGPSSLTLKSRRLDMRAVAGPLDRMLATLSEGASASGLGLPEIALAVDIEQVVVLGEETGETSLRGWLGAGGLAGARLGTSLAGARLGFDGTVTSTEAASGALTITIPDTRRLALALNRMGLEAELADAVSGLGAVELQARGQVASGGKAVLEQAIVTSPALRLAASGSSDDKQLALQLKLDGLDITRLPALTALATVAGGRDIRLDLALAGLRLGPGPTGEMQMALSRVRGTWLPGRFAASGFGGLSLRGDGQAKGDGVAGLLDAPQADVLLGLAGPFLPQVLRARLAGAVASLSPVALRYEIARRDDQRFTVKASGTAGRAGLDISGSSGSGDPAPELEIRLDLPERALLFQGLGLPRPASDGPARVMVRQAGGQGAVTASLAGPGLTVEAEGNETSGLALRLRSDSPAQLMPEALARTLPSGTLEARSRVTMSDSQTRLDDLGIMIGGAVSQGHLVLASSGAISGALKVPALNLPDLMGLGLQPPPGPAGPAFWASARFGSPPVLPPARIALQTPALSLAPRLTLAAAGLDLGFSAEGLTLDNITGRLLDGTAGGNLSLRREGGLASVSGRLVLDRIDPGPLTGGELTGRLSGRLEFGGAGESPARLVAGLGGAGEMQLENAAIAGLDPAALARVVTATDDSAAESDRNRLVQRLTPALGAAPWPLGTLPVQMTLSGGVLRFAPVVRAQGAARAEFAGLVDLRLPALDLKASLTMLGAAPRGWSGPMPQTVVTWRGPLERPRREVDPGALSNALAARALAREIERVEAFEADIRERSFFARRLRAERDMREAEAREAEAARLAEIQRILDENKRLEDERLAARNQQPLPPLPPPLDIRPVLPPPSRP